MDATGSPRPLRGALLASLSRSLTRSVPVLWQLYQELRFRVVLVGLDIWSHRDKIEISSQASTTLDNFMDWRVQNLLGRHPHDNAQLIT